MIDLSILKDWKNDGYNLITVLVNKLVIIIYYKIVKNRNHNISLL